MSAAVFLAAGCLLAVAYAPGAQAARSRSAVPSYTLIDLGPVMPLLEVAEDLVPPPAVATGINQTGVLLGNYWFTQDPDTAAFEIDPSNTFTSTAVAPTFFSFNWVAFDISSDGSTVGASELSPNTWQPIHAYLQSGGVVTDLGVLPTNDPSASSAALAIGNDKQVVGWSESDSGFDHAVVFRQGQVHDLGVPPGFTDSAATAIAGNQILGCAWTRTRIGLGIDLTNDVPCTEGFIAQSGHITLLGGFIPSTIPDALSQDGTIAGRFNNHAATWKNGHVTLLAGLGPNSRALAVNNNGDIVASSDNGALFLYHAGASYRLPSAPGGPITVAGFNDSGYIAGSALTPTPSSIGFVDRPVLLKPSS